MRKEVVWAPACGQRALPQLPVCPGQGTWWGDTAGCHVSSQPAPARGCQWRWPSRAQWRWPLRTKRRWPSRAHQVPALSSRAVGAGLEPPACFCAGSWWATWACPPPPPPPLQQKVSRVSGEPRRAAGSVAVRELAVPSQDGGLCWVEMGSPG